MSLDKNSKLFQVTELQLVWTSKLSVFCFYGNVDNLKRAQLHDIRIDQLANESRKQKSVSRRVNASNKILPASRNR